MKALTLWQPWASLIAVGAKRIETRSRSTSYRGPLAIHAAARLVAKYEHRDVNADVPEAIDLVKMGRFWEWYEHPDDPRHGGAYRWCGPLGAIVATCELVGVEPTDGMLMAATPSLVMQRDGRKAFWDPARERPFGDFTPGRFAWLLDNVRPLDEPIPAKGRQGLWEWAA